jgi:hypothetical protein
VEQPTDRGARKYERIDYQRSGFIIPAPDAPWIECFITDISENGLCLNVGALVVPEFFGVAFTPCGRVRRVCTVAWRQGELIGARFVTAKELRQGIQKQSDAKISAAPAGQANETPNRIS